MCRRWEESSQAFFEDMGERPAGLTLDRKNNDGHYSCGKCDECVANGWPANCRWATPSEQQRNRDAARTLTYNGETLNYADWSTRLGISSSTITRRVKMGWSIEEILSPADEGRIRKPAPPAAFGFIDMSGWEQGGWRVLERVKVASRATHYRAIHRCGGVEVKQGSQLRAKPPKWCHKCRPRRHRCDSEQELRGESAVSWRPARPIGALPEAKEKA